MNKIKIHYNDHLHASCTYSTYGIYLCTDLSKLVVKPEIVAARNLYEMFDTKYYPFSVMLAYQVTSMWSIRAEYPIF